MSLQITAHELQEEGLWVQYCEITGTELDAVEVGILDKHRLLEVPSDLAWVLTDRSQR